MSGATGAHAPGALPKIATGRIRAGSWRFLVRFWPLLVFAGYLTFTVIVFAFGPIPYPVTNPWTTYGFLAAAHLALVLGYLLVPFRIPTASPAPGDDWMFSVPNLVIVSSVLNIVLLTPWTLYMTSGDYDVIAALLDPGAAYLRTYRRAVATTNPFIYPIMLAAPLMALTVPLTLFYWRALSGRVRAVAVAGIVAVLFPAAMLGRNKGFADFIVIVVVFLLAHLFRREQPWSRRRWLMATSAGLIGILLFLAFFTISIETRGGRAAQGYSAAVGEYANPENIFLAPFPDAVEPTLAMLYNYLTQGYYGLSLSLRVDFVWTRGLGNSFFLHMVQDRFLGSELARRTCYPARVEEAFGYSMLGHWHTIYPWLASDLTFPGVVIFVALIGALLAITWFETLAGTNPFSVAMFANLCLMLVYFNANNQMLGFPVPFATIMGTLALWLFTRRRLARAGSAEKPAPPAKPEGVTR
ncbi:MAG: hypothetical protein PVJ51_10620 [Acidobacteriota bacterium]